MPSKYSQHPAVVHHHIVLKPHHKWLIGSFTTFIVIFMITLSAFSYMIYTKQEINKKVLEKKIADLKAETNENINSLSESMIQTKENIGTIGSQIGVINKEFATLKASAGEDFSRSEERR